MPMKKRAPIRDQEDNVESTSESDNDEIEGMDVIEDRIVVQLSQSNLVILATRCVSLPSDGHQACHHLYIYLNIYKDK